GANPPTPNNEPAPLMQWQWARWLAAASPCCGCFLCCVCAGASNGYRKCYDDQSENKKEQHQIFADVHFRLGAIASGFRPRVFWRAARLSRSLFALIRNGCLIAGFASRKIDNALRKLVRIAWPFGAFVHASNMAFSRPRFHV